MPDTPTSIIIALHIGRFGALLSIPLHILVIGSIVRFRRTDSSLNKSYFHMLANLCAIDLIRVIQMTLLKSWLYSLEGWRTANDIVLPRLNAVCQYFAYQANLFQLTAIALNRLLEMVLPTRAKKIWTSTITIILNLGSWLCGVSFAVPLLLPVHKMEYLAYYQGIFWSNDWDNQTMADAMASKSYMDGVSTGALIVSGLLLSIYVVTFIVMIKHRSTYRRCSSQSRKKYKAEANLTIQALMITSFVFLYNIGVILYTRECCPWFVAPDLVAMVWAAHYSGPMFALCMSTVLRKNVMKFFNRSHLMEATRFQQSKKTGQSKVRHEIKVANDIINHENMLELNDMPGPSYRIQFKVATV